MSKWRFIPYSEHGAALNMAIDDLLLDAVIDGEAFAILRLYGFAPPAVSIGYSQSLPRKTAQRISDQSIELVRRPTGGRAVLHLHDLTYSFLAADSSRGGVLETSVSGAYRQICQGLLEALRLLGVHCELGAGQAPYRHLADCFLATTGADLHYRGRKIAGSAQLRRRACVLQHGSIPLFQDKAAMSCLLDGGSDRPAAERHVNLFDLCGHKGFSELDDCLRRGFEHAFGCSFYTEALSSAELERASGRTGLYQYRAEASATAL